MVHTELTENAGQSTGADEEAGEVGETEEEKVDRIGGAWLHFYPQTVGRKRAIQQGDLCCLMHPQL